MPRTYSFDHYQVPKRDTTLVHDERDMPHEKYSEVAPAHGESRIHYGKKFSQTEELLNARRMNHQLEELAGVEAKDRSPISGELPETPELAPRTPIGALPPTAEASVLAPEGLLEGIRDEALTNLRQIREATRQLWAASFRLARLPLELARETARRLRPATA